MTGEWKQQNPSVEPCPGRSIGSPKRRYVAHVDEAGAHAPGSTEVNIYGSLGKNPAASERQRRLFGTALAVKRGAPPGRVGPEARRLARTLPERTLREFASKNPRLMVLNPADQIAAACERKLGRRLTGAEKSLLSLARHEFRTTHGREPTVRDVVPVDAPPGTPLFVNALGDLDRIDYTVKFPSERRGRWTHRAGDHEGARRTRPATIATIPGRKRHNYAIVEPRGADARFKPTHGLVG